LGGGGSYLSTQGLAMLAEQQAFGVFTAGALVIAVGIAPGAAQLGFANGLLLPLDDSLAEVTHRFAIIGSQFRWPAGEEHLEQHHFVACRGRTAIGQLLAQIAGRLPPVANLAGEPLGTLAEHRQARAGILAALV